MSKIIREFEPASRYLYDFGLCSYENGFSQVDTSQDAGYYGTWANPYKFIIFNYCEGDCTTTICDNAEDFVKEMRELKDWNNRMEHSCAVDPGLDPLNIARWNELGLSDLLLVNRVLTRFTFYPVY